ncbi:MAG: hypothetical protein KKF48_01675 [Nanoarchaeota archaeon]|nr:hypothetical protein [Nanoarchaeota archaeon]MBU1027730.1 hypothetical protein [Nanoarchaeota archaeon]
MVNNVLHNCKDSKSLDARLGRIIMQLESEKLKQNCKLTGPGRIEDHDSG